MNQQMCDSKKKKENLRQHDSAIFIFLRHVSLQGDDDNQSSLSALQKPQLQVHT